MKVWRRCQFSDFDPALRIEVDPATLTWELLPQAMEVGLARSKKHRKHKREERCPVAAGDRKGAV